MTSGRANFREHLITLGRKGGKARLTKMSALQRQEVARNAAQSRWGKRKIGEPSRNLSGSSPVTGCVKISGEDSTYPLLIKRAPLRLRLVCDALRQKGFQLPDRAWYMGDFVHLECSIVGHASGDDVCQLIVEILRRVGVIVSREKIQLFAFGKKLVVPVRVSGSGALVDFVHSGDYHTIDYQGHLYTLPDRAAAMIKFLHEAYTQGDPWCSAQALRAHLHISTSQRIDHLFRAHDGPRARQELVISDPSQRRYRINLPDSL